MKNIIKSALLCLVICCAVTACGPSIRKSLITKELPIIQPDKTMIVFEGHNHQLWARLDNNYGKKDESIYDFGGSWDTSYRGYHIHMLEPGDYALELVYFYFGGFSIELDHLGKNKFLSFVAKPGEIIYIGDIKFYPHPKGRFSGWEFKAEVKDEFVKAKAYLAKERPDINPNLLKKELVTIKPEVLKK